MVNLNQQSIDDYNPKLLDQQELKDSDSPRDSNQRYDVFTPEIMEKEMLGADGSFESEIPSQGIKMNL